MNNNSSNKKNTVTFEMLSDWHIGTGAGIPGSVDALLARDADGLPCIPAKTVVGIWRDAIETLTLGLDNGNAGNKNWQKWVDVIFGNQPNVDKNPNETPRPARLSIQPARLDKNLRDAIKGNVQLEQALTFVKPNTAVESASGTAKTDSLRFTETGRIGSVLDCEFSLDIEDFDDDAKKLVQALLTASAGLVERIGGNRRRGSGKCAMKVDCGLQDAVTILESYKDQTQKPLPEIPETPAKEKLETAEKAASDEWKRIEFSIKLESPALLSDSNIETLWLNISGNWRKSFEFLLENIDGTNVVFPPNLSEIVFGSSPFQIRKNSDIKAEYFQNEKGISDIGDAGNIFHLCFEFELQNIEPNLKKIVWAYLVLSASTIKNLGKNNSQGYGNVSVQFKDEFLTKAKEIINDLKEQDKSSNLNPNFNNEEPETAQTTKVDEWNRIEFSLKLETPVAIVTATLGNVSETLDFIPGTYLLPHITKTLGKSVSKYIASGDLRVLPATIEVEGNRGLPVPKVLYYHKVEGGFDKEKTVYNRLEEDISSGEQKKNYREGYISNLGENGTLLPNYETTKKILLMHNTVDDPVQRPTSEVGGVFSRQAIKAGQILKGEIRLKKSIADNLDKEKLNKLNSYVRLGTSKKDDYGYADLTLGAIGQAKSEASADTRLIVYLESDTLIRNDNLRQTNLVNHLKAELENKLSVKLTEKDSLIQVRRIESWHEGWGFPRPTLTAMAAGSVAVFEIQIDETKKAEILTKLQNLELSGIGERRGEGYGQIKFNPRILTEKINCWAVSQTNGKPQTNEKERETAIENLRKQVKTADKFKGFIQNIETAAWRDEIARAALKIADDPKKRKDIFGFGYKGKESVPPLSQIGGLRSTISKVKLDGSNKNVVINWLEHLKATSNREGKWEYKFGKINDLFKNDGDKDVWTLLEEKNATGQPVYFNPPKPLVSDETTLKNNLWAEAIKSLFDACARAHKRDEEQKKNNREVQN